ncbi:MAG: SDR family oxidoreductase [Microthrixaceae bacterium]|nr:SDR family oxidoreductase [Microthrixaceae bacterium]
MELRGKVAVVTGGGNGIGRALCRRFVAEGAACVVVADLGGDAAASVAAGLGDAAAALEVNVALEGDVVRLVEITEDRYGPIDLFCSNAGIAAPAGGVEAPTEGWQQIWDVNVMAHVYAARTLIPRMVDRGGGYLLNTASAAGLLTNLGAAPYSVTKHAAVGLAEWLAITHGDQGIKVSCLCPQGVRTNMLLGAAGDAPDGDPAQLAGAVVLAQGAIEPEDVAEAVVAGLADERFLILPHPEVLDYFRNKAGDYDRWIGGMRKLGRGHRRRRRRCRRGKLGRRPRPGGAGAAAR